MKMDKKIAEFIGIMLGDGCIGIYDCKNKNKIKKQHQLKVTLDSRNKEYISYVYNLMKVVLNINPVVNIKKNENTADIRTFRKEKIFWALKSLKLKISPKQGKMKIPEGYSKGKLALFVLRGLFDTDGSVTIFQNNGKPYPRIEIRVMFSPSQGQIKKILKENGFRFRIQKLENNKIRIRLSGKRELKKWFKIIGSSNKSHLKRARQFL